MWAWFLSPIGRRVGLGIAAVLVLFAAVKWYEGKIRADEQAKNADRNTQEIEKLRAADRAATQEILYAAQEKQQEAERRMQASLDREAGLVRAISSIQSSRVETGRTVANVADTQLHSFNVKQMGVRESGDATSCYTVPEERAIATALTQYPLCQKQVEAQAAQIQEVKEQVAAQNAKIDAMEVKFDALAGYTTRLEGYYVTVYNAIPRKKRGWKCLGLWACSKRPPLPAPDPISLKQGAPNAK